VMLWPLNLTLELAGNWNGVFWGLRHVVGTLASDYEL
jgi:hypothetical protein